MPAAFDARPAALNLLCPQGDRLVIPFAVTAGGDDYPLDGTVTAVVTPPGGSSVLASFTVGGTPSVDGTGTLTLLEAATLALSVGSYGWRFVWTSAAGRKRTLVAGTLTVTVPTAPGDGTLGTLNLALSDASIGLTIAGVAYVLPDYPVVDGFYVKNRTTGSYRKVVFEGAGAAGALVWELADSTPP